MDASMDSTINSAIPPTDNLNNSDYMRVEAVPAKTTDGTRPDSTLSEIGGDSGADSLLGNSLLNDSEMVLNDIMNGHPSHKHTNRLSTSSLFSDDGLGGQENVGDVSAISAGRGGNDSDLDI